jgi:hypothetical protein
VRRGKTNVGSTADADEHAREPDPSVDPVDQERIFGALGKELTPAQIEALADAAAGVPYAELAAEGRTTEPAKRKWMQRVREKARGAMSKQGYQVAGFAALVSAILGVYFVAIHEPGGTAGRHRHPGTALEEAAEERREAAEACRAAVTCQERNWNSCEDALDTAARLDPDGERAAEVKELRAAIAAARRPAGAGDGGAANGAGDAGAPEKRTPAERR